MEQSLGTVLENAFMLSLTLMHSLYNARLAKTFGIHMRRSPIRYDLSHKSVTQLLQWILCEPITFRIKITKSLESGASRASGLVSFFKENWFNIELSELNDADYRAVLLLCRLSRVCFAQTPKSWKAGHTLEYEGFIPNAELERYFPRVEIAKRVCAIYIRVAAPRNLFAMHDILLQGVKLLFASSDLDIPRAWKENIAHFVEYILIPEYLKNCN